MNTGFKGNFASLSFSRINPDCNVFHLKMRYRRVTRLPVRKPVLSQTAHPRYT